MSGIIRAAGILLLSSLALPAQTRTPDANPAQIRELLNSQRLDDQVWGVYYAGRVHDAGLHDLLVDRLRHVGPLANSAYFSREFFYVAALLDSLIETGEPVPLDAFVSFEPRWQTQELILLSRQQGNEAALLALRDTPMHKLYWLAVNNLLLQMRSARFISATLADVRITCTFEVRDSPVKELGSGTAGSIASGPGPDAAGRFPADRPVLRRRSPRRRCRGAGERAAYCVLPSRGAACRCARDVP